MVEVISYCSFDFIFLMISDVDQLVMLVYCMSSLEKFLFCSNDLFVYPYANSIVLIIITFVVRH